MRTRPPIAGNGSSCLPSLGQPSAIKRFSSPANSRIKRKLIPANFMPTNAAIRSKARKKFLNRCATKFENAGGNNAEHGGFQNVESVVNLRQATVSDVDPTQSDHY